MDYLIGMTVMAGFGIWLLGGDANAAVGSKLVDDGRPGFGALRFSANAGQWPGEIQFCTVGEGEGVTIDSRGVLVAGSGSAGRPTFLRMTLGGKASKPFPRAVGDRLTRARANYYRGQESLHRSDVPVFERVVLPDVYDGIDLVCYGSAAGRFEYDFVVSPGVAPSSIAIHFEFRCADGEWNDSAIRVLSSGDLEVENGPPGSTTRFKAPRSYQIIDGKTHEIDSRFELAADGTFGFEVGAYDRTAALVIDPELLYSTVVGTNSSPHGSDRAVGVGLDSLGNAWVAGTVDATGFPVTADAADSTYNDGSDVAVVKFSPAGELLYATYLGGSLSDLPWAVDVATDGDVWITGETSSSNFPTAGSPAQGASRGSTEIFLTRLSASGQLEYSTYFGGQRGDRPRGGMALDPTSGAIWICGATNSIDFPVTAGAAQPMIASAGGPFPFDEMFVAKFSSAGTLEYATYLGGSVAEEAGGIDVDSSGNAWVSGTVQSSFESLLKFPTTAGARVPDRPVTPSGTLAPDAFLVKYSPSGARLYASFLQGSLGDRAYDVVVDSSDHVWVIGETNSDDLEVTSDAFQPGRAGNSFEVDVFLQRYDSSGANLLYGTYFGGSGRDIVTRGAVQADDAIWITGTTFSAGDFPVASTAAQPIFGGGGQDMFVAGFAAGGSVLRYSSLLGGSGADFAQGIAIGGTNVAWVVGGTWSPNFPAAGAAGPYPPDVDGSLGQWAVAQFGLGAPPISLVLDPDPLDADIGDTITLMVEMTNELTSDLTDVRPVGDLVLSGSGKVEVLSGPSPLAVALLGAGETATVTYELRAVEPGDVTAALQVRGESGNGTVLSGQVSSPVIRVASVGDLLVRAAGQDALANAANDVYQTTPAGKQIERVAVKPGGEAGFKITIQNDGVKDTAFVATATEDGEPGWTVSFSRAGADITGAMGGGWESPRLASGESIEIDATLVPDAGTATGAAKAVTVTLQSTGESADVLDSVALQASVETIFVTVDPEEALLSEPVSVEIHFVNDTNSAMTMVSPALGVIADVSGDATVSDPDPATIPVLQPGEEAVFTYELKGTETGEITLLGQATYHQNGGGPFFTPIIQVGLRIGAIELTGLEPIQVIPEVPMIAGKPTQVLLTSNNPLSIPKEVPLTLTVELPGRADEEFPVTVLLQPGQNKGLIPSGGQWFEPVSSGTLKATVDPDNDELPNYAGRTKTEDLKVTATNQLDLGFCRPEFAARFGLPAVDGGKFFSIVSEGGAFIDAVYPMAPVGDRRADVLSVDWTDRPLSPDSLLSAAGRKAVRDGVDRLAIVVPEHPSTYAFGVGSGVSGYFSDSVPKVVVISQDSNPSDYPNVVAHEIGHSFGFPDALQTVNPDVDFGVWVTRELQFADAFNFMSYGTPAWVNQPTYESLISILSRPVLDPQVLLLSGCITPAGEVMADPWTTILTDQVSVSDPDGQYAFELRDGGGNVLRRFRFDVQFEITEAAINGDGEVGSATVQLPRVPFAFSIIRPPGLASVVIKDPNNLPIFTRVVSNNPPQVTSVTVSGNPPYFAGDSLTVSWAGEDADGDALTYALLYSEDGGRTSKLVCEFINGNQCDWTVPFDATSRGILKVEASDGINSGEMMTEEFGIIGFEPRVIVDPGPDAMTTPGGTVVLDGTGSHSSEGDDIVFYEWEVIGSPDGGDAALATPGESMTEFAATVPGLYVIRLTAGDYFSIESATTTVFVEPAELPELFMTMGIDGVARLSWSASSPRSVLEISDDLSLWKVSPEVPGLALDKFQLSFDSAETERLFFRLSSP